MCPRDTYPYTVQLRSIDAPEGVNNADLTYTVDLDSIVHKMDSHTGEWEVRIVSFTLAQPDVGLNDAHLRLTVDGLHNNRTLSSDPAEDHILAHIGAHHFASYLQADGTAQVRPILFFLRNGESATYRATVASRRWRVRLLRGSGAGLLAPAVVQAPGVVGGNAVVGGAAAELGHYTLTLELSPVQKDEPQRAKSLVPTAPH